jgi:hypothetical protein
MAVVVATVGKWAQLSRWLGRRTPPALVDHIDCIRALRHYKILVVMVLSGLEATEPNVL